MENFSTYQMRGSFQSVCLDYVKHIVDEMLQTTFPNTFLDRIYTTEKNMKDFHFGSTQIVILQNVAN